MKELLKLFKKPDRSEERRRTQDFRSVFGSEAGKRVLGYMLADMHFFDEILNTEEERVLQNYARRILAYCGAWRGQNVPAIVDSLFRLPWQDEPNQERSADQ